MRNCVVLGSGRSGTSMVTGTLAQAGYFMGNYPTPATVRVQETNPKGQYEDQEINEINEIILAQVVPDRPWLLGRWFFRDRLTQWQRWLAQIPLETRISSPSSVLSRIKALTKHQPFCFKDPRFSYSLPVWKPFLEETNAVYICVFRDPASTALSILKQCEYAHHLRGLHMTNDQALAMWTYMYEHIIEIHCHKGDWLFLHYNQVLSPQGLDKLEAFTEASVDRSFPDASIRRSVSTSSVSTKTQNIYDKLCHLANYEG